MWRFSIPLACRFSQRCDAWRLVVAREIDAFANIPGLCLCTEFSTDLDQPPDCVFSFVRAGAGPRWLLDRRFRWTLEIGSGAVLCADAHGVDIASAGQTSGPLAKPENPVDAHDGHSVVLHDSWPRLLDVLFRYPAIERWGEHAFLDSDSRCILPFFLAGRHTLGALDARFAILGLDTMHVAHCGLVVASQLPHDQTLLSAWLRSCVDCKANSQIRAKRYKGSRVAGTFQRVGTMDGTFLSGT